MPFRCIKRRNSSHRELLIIEPKESLKRKKPAACHVFLIEKKAVKKRLPVNLFIINQTPNFTKRAFTLLCALKHESLIFFNFYFS